MVSRIIVYPLIPREDHVGVVTEAEVEQFRQFCAQAKQNQPLATA
jgi:hypothetical protein